MLKYWFPAAALLILLAAGPATADDVDAFRNWTEGQRDQALAEWRRLAAAGDPLAQYNLATLYLQGGGVPQSRETAIQWLRKSAEAGNLLSMELLGTLLLGGNSFKPDYPEAFRLLSRAAAAGSIIAENNLAAMYMNGLGTPVDLLQAHRYASEAQAGGNGTTTALLAEIERRMTPQQRMAIAGAPSPATTRPAPKPLMQPATAQAEAEAAPAQPEAAPAPTEAAPQGGETDQGWLVHLASVAKPADAHREWERLQKLSAKLQGFTPKFVDVELAGNVQVTRIFIEGFPDRESAKRFCEGITNTRCLPTRKANY